MSISTGVDMRVANPVTTTATLAEIRDELRRKPQLMAYLQALKKLLQPETAHPVVLASSYTVRPLEPYLQVESLLSGWRIEPLFVEYSQWQKALLVGDQSVDPEAYVLLLHPESLLSIQREVAESLELAQRLLDDTIRAFRARSETPLFIFRLPNPRPINTLAFGRGPTLRYADAVDRLNACLDSLAAELPSVYVIDGSAAMAEVGPHWRNVQALYSTLSPISNAAAPRVAEAIARSLAPLFRARRKVLMTDLDNTLWGGVVGEVGSEGVALGNGWPGEGFRVFQRAIHELAESGIILAINSKNNEADARSVFEKRNEMILRWDDFACHRINWKDKAENLSSIAEELLLGTDSFVFVDDNPVECERIRVAFPDVEVVQLPEDPARFVDALLQCRGFDTIVTTQEDLLRTKSYRAEGHRRSLQVSAQNYDEFLESLGLKIVIRPCDAEVFDRLHQLLLKTNQFHLTLERPSPAALKSRSKRLFSIALRDKFGDYGVIGALEIAFSTARIEIHNLALSCRALGRLVEEAVLAFVAERGRAVNASSIETTLVAGPRNAPARIFLEKAGFVSENDSVETARRLLPITKNEPAFPGQVTVDRPLPEAVESTC